MFRDKFGTESDKKTIVIRKRDLRVAIVAREAMILWKDKGEDCCIKGYLSDHPDLVKELETDITTEKGLCDLADYLNRDNESEYFYQIQN